MIIGFTGTREGMTNPQAKSFVEWLEPLNGNFVLHHGDCVGADADAAFWTVELGGELVIHPPSDPRLRAFTDDGTVRPAKPYLDRNRDIVDACDRLIAAPKETDWQDRGGTWYTIRYADKAGKPVTIIWPDGRVS
jgi:hypothetical protein